MDCRFSCLFLRRRRRKVIREVALNAFALPLSHIAPSQVRAVSQMEITFVAHPFSFVTRKNKNNMGQQMYHIGRRRSAEPECYTRKPEPHA